MTLYDYGGTPDSYVADRNTGVRMPAVSLTILDSETGTAVTGLFDGGGTPAATITTDSHGYYDFSCESPAVLIRVTDSLGITNWGPVSSPDAVRDLIVSDPAGDAAAASAAAAAATTTANAAQTSANTANAALAAFPHNSTISRGVADAHPTSAITGLDTALAGKAPTVHTHAGTDIASGTVPLARLGSGTPTVTTFLRGDGLWAVPAGGGGGGGGTVSGNLVTANQASVETDTTGFSTSGSNPFTLARDSTWSAHGTYSLKATVVGTSFPAVIFGATGTYSSGVAIQPSTEYTYHALVNPGTMSGTNLSGLRMYLYYYTSAGAQIGSASVFASTASGSNLLFKPTETSPSTAAWVLPRIVINNGTAIAGQFMYIDQVGVWQGSSGTWALPGEVIPADATTRITAPNTDDVLAEQYDASNTRWQRVHYDTGTRDVTSLVAITASGQTGKLTLRRVNDEVVWEMRALVVEDTAGIWDIMTAIPASFRPSARVVIPAAAVRSTVNGNRMQLDGTIRYQVSTAIGSGAILPGTELTAPPN